MSPTCTNSHYDNHATFVPSINHNKDVALLSYVELYYNYYTYLYTKKICNLRGKLCQNLYLELIFKYIVCI